MNKELIIKRIVQSSGTNNPMQYVRNIVKDLDKDNLNKQIEECSKCSNCSSCKSKAYGNPNSPLMIIGDSYDLQSMEIGNAKPFNKEDYAYIKVAIDFLKLNYDEIFFMNAVNCTRIRDIGNMKKEILPSHEQIQNCRSFTNYAIDFVQPDVIVLMGGVASGMFFNEAIMAIRGQWNNIRGVPVIATYDPKYLRDLNSMANAQERAKEKRLEFLDDINKAVNHIRKIRPNSKLFLD